MVGHVPPSPTCGDTPGLCKALNLSLMFPTGFKEVFEGAYNNLITVHNPMLKISSKKINSNFSCYLTMDVIKACLLVLLFISRVLSFISLLIIWTYLRKKSPAMQTLKDEMIKEVIQSSILMILSVDPIMIRQRKFRKRQ